MKTTFLIALFLVVVACSAANADECTTGDVKNVDCNSCRCLNGQWACTRRGCLRKRDTECQPGESKKIDCNHCFCAGGHWACTLIGCNVKAAECSTGQTKQEDCNTCFCANGNWACTLKACLRKRAADECLPGDRKTVECNTCFCANGLWACTKIGCHAKRAIPARFDVESRHKRDMHVAEDLKDTPCAPNDYFQVDCNVCYCNLEHSGYLCTNNYCYNYDESTTVKIPLENDSMLILSRDGVRFIENASSRINSRSRIRNNPGENRDGTTTDVDNELTWKNNTEQPFDFSNQSVSSENVHE